MTYENINPEAEPSLEEQQRRLNTLLASNMQTMIQDRAFFAHLMERYEATHNRKPGGNDQSLSVMLSYSRKPVENGASEESEHLYVGFTSHYGNGSSTSSLVPIADRVETADGKKLMPKDGFTDEQAAMVANMADDLILAKVSGQIPDLHALDLNHLYVPSDYIDPVDR